MSKELQNQRAQLTVEMRAIVQKAEAEKRAFTAEENEGWDRRKAAIESIDATIARKEEQRKLDAAAAIPVDGGAAHAAI